MVYISLSSLFPLAPQSSLFPTLAPSNFFVKWLYVYVHQQLTRVPFVTVYIVQERKEMEIACVPRFSAMHH
jgi:hypothetical protein